VAIRIFLQRQRVGQQQNIAAIDAQGAIELMREFDGFSGVAAFSGQGRQRDGMRPRARLKINCFWGIETAQGMAYRVTKSRCSYGVTLSWSIYNCAVFHLRLRLLPPIIVASSAAILAEPT
jgi:hypothetical protein